MIYKVDLEKKIFYVDIHNEYPIDDIFNFIHSVDCDNASEWVIRFDANDGYVHKNVAGLYSDPISNCQRKEFSWCASRTDNIKL